MNLPEKWSEICSKETVILGLKRYSFRREYAKCLLEKLGFTCIRLVDAFDGFQENPDEALVKLGIHSSSQIGPGHKGLCITFIRLLQEFIDSGESYRIFFEDDVLGHMDLPHGLGQKFWDETPKDFDILYLGNMMNPGDSKELVIQVPTYTTHALMITRNGARRILDLYRELGNMGEPLLALDIQLLQWELQKKLIWYCWNGTWIQKSYPTFDEALPWQIFPNVILPQKDTGIFWQNMRVGTTLEHPDLQLTIPQYSR